MENVKSSATNLTLDQSISAAEANLPEGWIIEISVERGSTTVRLEGPDGNGVHFDATGSLADAVRKATDRAMEG